MRNRRRKKALDGKKFIFNVFICCTHLLNWLIDRRIMTDNCTALVPETLMIMGQKAISYYIHSRALFRVACSRSPLSKGSIFLQPAQDTAREQVTFYLTSSDIARGPERYGPEHFQIILVPVKSPSASTYYFNFDNTKN